MNRELWFITGLLLAAFVVLIYGLAAGVFGQ